MSFLFDCPCGFPTESRQERSEETSRNVEGRYQPLAESIPLLIKDQMMVTYTPDASHYELLGVLGVGYIGSAIVSRARHCSVGHIIAIKCINLENPGIDLAQIQHEVLVTRQMHHANILPYFSSFIHNREIWIVMPYMMYGSAHDLVKRSFIQGMPELIIAYILHDVIHALDYLHRHGMIHRSVRASHILISGKGQVFLTGFRYSCSMINSGKLLRSLHHFTADIMPNLNWLCPELLEQNLLGYDTKSDVYSVGITACELANGVVPFAHMPPTEMLLEKLRGATPVLLDAATCPLEDDPDLPPEAVDEGWPPHFRQKSFSEGFHKFVAMCMYRDPFLRPSPSQLLQHIFFKQCRRSVPSLAELLHEFVDLPEMTDSQDGHLVDTSVDQLDNLAITDVTWNF